MSEDAGTLKVEVVLQNSPEAIAAAKRLAAAAREISAACSCLVYANERLAVSFDLLVEAMSSWPGGDEKEEP